MMSGGTLNWKMWVFKMCLDTVSPQSYATKCNSTNKWISVYFYSFCREWLCWWWAQPMPCLRNLLSVPCLWRTWLRSSWPQRWVSPENYQDRCYKHVDGYFLHWRYQLNVFSSVWCLPSREHNKHGVYPFCENKKLRQVGNCGDLQGVLLLSWHVNLCSNLQNISIEEKFSLEH